MALNIRSNQIRLADSFDFSSGVVSVAAPSADAHAATKKYVDDEIAGLAVPTAGNGISIDGSLVVSVNFATDGALQFIGAGSDELSVKLDGSTLAKSASGLKVADGGIGSAQLADDSITTAKLAWSFNMDGFDGDGSATSFNLSETAYDAAAIMVHVNGQMLERVASTPAFGQYTATTSAVTLGGTARDANDRIVAIYPA